MPAGVRLAHTVMPVTRSCTNTSLALLLSPGTRLLALLANATWRPSADADGSPPGRLPGIPSEFTCSSVVVCGNACAQRSVRRLRPRARVMETSRDATHLRCRTSLWTLGPG